LNSADPASPEDKITSALAKNSSLTETQARPVAKAAVKAAGAKATNDQMADSVMSSLGGFSGDSLQLSSPVMLWPWARAVASLLLLLTSGLCAGFIFGGSSTTGNYNVTLAVIGVAALLAAVILVMGYKNVTISKGTGSASAGGGGGGDAGAKALAKQSAAADGNDGTKPANAPAQGNLGDSGTQTP
jgi:hypothetical protein